MANLQRIYYINLDRKEARRNNIERYFPDDPRLTRISAVDGTSQRHIVTEKRSFFVNDDLQRAIDYELDVNPDKTEPKYQCYRTDIHFAVMGNALSHFRTWEAAAKDLEHDSDVALIMQDDAIISDDFFVDVERIISDIPTDAKVVWLSRHSCAIGGHFVKVNFDEEPDIDALFEKRKNDTIGNLRLNCNPCSLAYLVTKEGAKWLVRSTHSVTGAMDNHMNCLLYHAGIQYATYKPYMTSDTKNFRSDIFTEAP